MSLLVAIATPIIGTGGLVALVRVCLRHGSDAVLKLGVALSSDKDRRKDCIKALRVVNSQPDDDPPELPDLPGK